MPLTKEAIKRAKLMLVSDPALADAIELVLLELLMSERQIIYRSLADAIQNMPSSTSYTHGDIVMNEITKCVCEHIARQILWQHPND